MSDEDELRRRAKAFRAMAATWKRKGPVYAEAEAHATGCASGIEEALEHVDRIRADAAAERTREVVAYLRTLPGDEEPSVPIADLIARAFPATPKEKP